MASVSTEGQLVNRYLLVSTLLAAGCGAARKDLGEVQVKTMRPMTSTQRFDYVNFHVQDGRLFVSSPNVPTDFDLVAEDDGCLRGSSGIRQLHYCPVSLRPDADGTWHWRSVNGDMVVFSTRLKDEGSILEIGAVTYRAEVELGKTPADDEIRRHPGLMGAAFARGLFPSSKDEEGSDSEQHEWRYVLLK